MKASDLVKVSEVSENLYKRISEANSNGGFKIFIPHYLYVKDELRAELINNGYKLYKGNWDGAMIDALIIEW